MKNLSTSPEARIFPLAFEFNATPPARHTFRQRVFLNGAIRHDAHHRSFTCFLDSKGDVFVTIVNFALRDPRWTEQRTVAENRLACTR